MKEVSMAARIREFYESPLTGEAIEALSFAAIDGEAPAHHFSPRQWQVVRRMVHTTADFGLLQDTRFSETALDAGIEALRSGATVYADSNMIRRGLSLSRLRQVCPDYGPESIICHVANPEVASDARQAGWPRSLCAVRHARPQLDGAIVAIGNAPVALLELNRLVLEEGLRPALVIGVPVGFVHVVESKEELTGLDVPFITILGRRGGSPLAVSIVHALCSLAQS
jgi:precorrin isomerase